MVSFCLCMRNIMCPVNEFLPYAVCPAEIKKVKSEGIVTFLIMFQICSTVQNSQATPHFFHHVILSNSSPCFLKVVKFLV